MILWIHLCHLLYTSKIHQAEKIDDGIEINKKVSNVVRENFAMKMSHVRLPSISTIFSLDAYFKTFMRDLKTV